jgi:pyocin large subunit-like protein
MTMTGPYGADFAAKSADEYAAMASEFLQRGGAQGIATKIAPDGTIRMFDPVANTFGSFAPNGTTLTFFKPTSPTYWARQPGVLQ